MKPEDCLPLQGLFTPVIDLHKCKSESTCVSICPFSVFEMRAMDEQVYSELSFVGKLKTFISGKERAAVVNADSCHACGDCVRECQEGAITLERANSHNN